MNAKQVLSKIINALSMEKEVAMAYAKLADGTILESPTFDVGEEVSVVSEDGTKSAAPNGEHEVILKDSEGNDVRIKVMTTDGKITERENVELADDAKKEEVKKLPEDLESIAGEDIGGGEEESEDEEVEPITEDMGKKYADLAYRISEMEKKMQSMEEIGKAKEDEIKGKPAEDKKEADIKMEEEELPKLDGAPIDESPLANALKEKQKFGKTVGSPQNTFLSKLYK
jgi:flagellar hook-length control protein FliK